MAQPTVHLADVRLDAVDEADLRWLFCDAAGEMGERSALGAASSQAPAGGRTHTGQSGTRTCPPAQYLAACAARPPRRPTGHIGERRPHARSRLRPRALRQCQAVRRLGGGDARPTPAPSPPPAPAIIYATLDGWLTRPPGLSARHPRTRLPRPGPSRDPPRRACRAVVDQWRSRGGRPPAPGSPRRADANSPPPDAYRATYCLYPRQPRRTGGRRMTDPPRGLASPMTDDLNAIPGDPAPTATGTMARCIGRPPGKPLTRTTSRQTCANTYPSAGTSTTRAGSPPTSRPGASSGTTSPARWRSDHARGDGSGGHRIDAADWLIPEGEMDRPALSSALADLRSRTTPPATDAAPSRDAGGHGDPDDEHFTLPCGATVAPLSAHEGRVDFPQAPIIRAILANPPPAMTCEAPRWTPWLHRPPDAHPSDRPRGLRLLTARQSAAWKGTASPGATQGGRAREERLAEPILHYLPRPCATPHRRRQSDGMDRRIPRLSVDLAAFPMAPSPAGDGQPPARTGRRARRDGLRPDESTEIVPQHPDHPDGFLPGTWTR